MAWLVILVVTLLENFLLSCAASLLRARVPFLIFQGRNQR